MTLVITAAVGAAIGFLIERHTRFERLASYHAARGAQQPMRGCLVSDQSEWRIDMQIWHAKISERYGYVARHPWQFVGALPQEPQFEFGYLRRKRDAWAQTDDRETITRLLNPHVK